MIQFYKAVLHGDLAPAEAKLKVRPDTQKQEIFVTPEIIEIRPTLPISPPVPTPRLQPTALRAINCTFWREAGCSGLLRAGFPLATACASRDWKANWKQSRRARARVSRLPGWLMAAYGCLCFLVCAIIKRMRGKYLFEVQSKLHLLNLVRNQFSKLQLLQLHHSNEPQNDATSPCNVLYPNPESRAICSA